MICSSLEHYGAFDRCWIGGIRLQRQRICARRDGSAVVPDPVRELQPVWISNDALGQSLHARACEYFGDATHCSQGIGSGTCALQFIVRFHARGGAISASAQCIVTFVFMRLSMFGWRYELL